MQASHTDCSMRIPRHFAEKFLSGFVGQATLEGPSGWIWYTSTERKQNSIFLSNPGWKEFAVDHCLQQGDFLKFSYVGENYFEVQIFGNRGREKGLQSMPEGGGTQSMLQRKGKTAYGCILKVSKVSRKKKKNPSTQLERGRIKGVGSSGKTKSRKDCMRYQRGKGCIEVLFKDGSTNKTKVLYISLLYTDESERERVAHAALSYIGNRPLVGMIMRKSNVSTGYKMFFPRQFADKYMPREDFDLTFLDPLGRGWKVKWLGTRKHPHGSAGWRKFATRNHLQENDICFFELINENNLEFQVYISRVGKCCSHMLSGSCNIEQVANSCSQKHARNPVKIEIEE